MTHATDRSARRYIRVELTFTECDAEGRALEPVVVGRSRPTPRIGLSDFIAVAAQGLTVAHVFDNAVHCAQYVLMRPNVEETAETFAKAMIGGAA